MLKSSDVHRRVRPPQPIYLFSNTVTPSRTSEPHTHNIHGTIFVHDRIWILSSVPLRMKPSRQVAKHDYMRGTRILQNPGRHIVYVKRE